MKRIMVCTFLCCISLLSQAADDTTVVEESELYDQKMCVERTANDCVSTICLTSEERDCTDQCQVDAQAKCNEKFAE